MMPLLLLLLLLTLLSLTACAHVCPHAVCGLQAHERGELVQAQDNATYALDGLVPEASLDTQRESACSLLQVLATRKGRLALRWVFCLPLLVVVVVVVVVAAVALQTRWWWCRCCCAYCGCG